jgi:hypothetical protein
MRKSNAHRILVVKTEQKEKSGDVGIDERIILKRILRE